PLFDIPAMKEEGKKAYYIAAADFVTTEEGTGIVHTAVMYGEDDYRLGKELGLPEVPMLNEAGHFLDIFSLTEGQYFKKAEKTIKANLEERGLLFAKKQNTHSYPHCWRCGTALFYNAISAWFIDIQGEVKERMLKLNENVNWFPDHLKHGRFQHILETAPDWNISRNRYWATALPFWKCDKEECDEVVCVGSVKELKERASNFTDVYESEDVTKIDLHKHKMDLIHLTCSCGSQMTRIPEVIDCWVEAASMPYAEFHYPFENKELFDKRFPGQFIAEYIAQTRAWFYYMHVMSTLLFDSNSFENVVTTGTIMSDKGEKLSKSKRNFTDPWIIIEQHGMDALRYYLMTSVVMQSENVNFVDREVKEIYNKVLNILWNVVSFYEMFASELVEGNENMVSENVLDKWILAKLHILIEETTTHLDAYNTVKGGRPIKEFIAELSTWYVRRSRERFKGEDEDDKQHALRTLREVLLTLSKVMAPFTPFIAEQIYKKMNGKEESVHLSSWPQVDESLKNPELLAEVEKIRKMVEMGLSLRKDAGVRVRQPLQVCSVGDFSFSDEGLRHMIKSELNVKEVITEDVSGDNWQTKEDAGFTVSLNTDISPELKKEGLVREIVRAVNQIRKEQGFTREHEIIVSYSTEDTMLNEVFIEYAGDIQKSVLAKEIKDGGEKDVTINNALVKLSVEKI
ncbi:MAG: class I tRNA ligase family protein, partial [Candidatus Magasanikbacteria bacterium]|nr:class I tRNA ligase family protein [Candidatus Magasanikbacteria bacterium]